MLVSDLDPAPNGFGSITTDQTEHLMHVMLLRCLLSRLDNVAKMGLSNLSSIPAMLFLEGGKSGEMVPRSENASACTRSDA